jgi:ATP-dependent exoDNAse (exonuclease V) alpha subunit
MPLSDARKIDLGYASTSHAAQGSTVDRVIVHIDSARGTDLVNQRQLYVSVSRPRLEARIYTDSTERMRRAAARTQEKELALDLVQKQTTATIAFNGNALLTPNDTIEVPT